MKLLQFLKTMSYVFILTSFLAFSATGQDNYKAHNDGWMVSVEKAQAASLKTGKPIMANFTGSDWCGWCKRLTANVFSKPEFKKWAEKNVVLLELDFPRGTKLPQGIQQQNYSLQKAFSVTGYPTVWVFYLKENAETGQMNIDPVGRTGYKNTVKEFTDEVDQMITSKTGS